MGRDRNPEGESTRAAWFKAGHLIHKEDTELSDGNLGLGSRERQGMGRENSRAWGSSMFAIRDVSARGAEAERRGRVQGRRGWTETDKGKEAPSGWFGFGRRLVEKREGPFGQQQVTRKNRLWYI